MLHTSYGRPSIPSLSFQILRLHTSLSLTISVVYVCFPFCLYSVLLVRWQSWCMVVLLHGLATHKRYVFVMCRCCHATTAELLMFCIPSLGNCILRYWLRHGDTTGHYTKCTKKCQLCLSEKLRIITASKKSRLNCWTEHVSKCCHQHKFLLSCTIHYT